MRSGIVVPLSALRVGHFLSNMLFPKVHPAAVECENENNITEEDEDRLKFREKFISFGFVTCLLKVWF